MLARGVGAELGGRSREERGVEESRMRMLATEVRGIMSALVAMG